ncbi:hypothetical protein F4801DRAFT_471475 [Xylaria longipes]|nr:hypothetical protein F4801DRAFT_471475 [Xylaria longipes]RYC64999.1 hypothetical protein CHU98_g1208 [Xylaria longipes]
MSFTLMPFLYQTRTILRIPAHRAAAGIVRSLHATARRTGENDIPFDYEIGPPGVDVPVAEVANRGTITPSERQIFERIFADIEARSLKPVVKDGGEPINPAANRSTRLIMQQAALDAGQAREATVTAPAILSGAAKDRAKALLRFPPPLRAAAEKALDTIKQQAKSAKYNDDAHDAAAREDEFVDNEWQAPAHTFARTVELEAKRFPERTRIEGLITSAKSDFELWDVLEKEVFTMPARLGIVKAANRSDDAEASPKARKRGRPSTAKSPDEPSHDTEPKLEAAEVNTTSVSSDNVSDPGDPRKLSLYVHGPLYPAYLLLALRRLDTAFSAPSSLVFSILPRIKELGLESYVLGVSTPFFNDLLAIYWARHGDLSGMLELLEEMRHCGLYFDSRTASILNRADEALFGLASGKERSGFGRALMSMPEYEHSQRNRIRHWHREVDLSVQQRKDDIGYRESTSMRG